MPQVVNLWGDTQERQPAKQKKQLFQFGLTPSVALTVPEDDVKFSIVARLQIKLIVRKYPQSTDSNIAGQQVGQTQHTGRRERKSAIEQCRVYLRRGLGSHSDNLRLLHSVPILQPCLDVSLQKVDSAEKVVCIGIARIQVEGPAQVTSRLRITLLLECDSGQLQREPLIARLQPGSCGKRLLGVRQASQLSQGRSVVEIEIGGRILRGMAQAYNFLPTLLGKKLFGPVGHFTVGRIALSATQGCTTEEKEYQKSGGD